MVRFRDVLFLILYKIHAYNKAIKDIGVDKHLT